MVLIEEDEASAEPEATFDGRALCRCSTLCDLERDSSERPKAIGMRICGVTRGYDTLRVFVDCVVVR